MTTSFSVFVLIVALVVVVVVIFAWWINRDGRPQGVPLPPRRWLWLMRLVGLLPVLGLFATRVIWHPPVGVALAIVLPLIAITLAFNIPILIRVRRWHHEHQPPGPGARDGSFLE